MWSKFAKLGIFSGRADRDFPAQLIATISGFDFLSQLIATQNTLFPVRFRKQKPTFFGGKCNFRRNTLCHAIFRKRAVFGVISEKNAISRPISGGESGVFSTCFGNLLRNSHFVNHSFANHRFVNLSCANLSFANIIFAKISLISVSYIYIYIYTFRKYQFRKYQFRTYQ